MTQKLLIVEDDVDINNLLRDVLSEYYDITQSFSGLEAKFIIESETFDGILLDLSLPKIRGEELIRWIREFSEVPIIVITAQAEINTLVDVLGQGANDYIAKPFDTKEVLARVMAQLRASNQTTAKEIVVGPLAMNLSSRSFRVHREEVVLTQKEFDLMHVFMSNPNRVFSKQQLYELVWKDTYFGDDNTISVHISRLRAKLLEHYDQDLIETIWGVGFKFKI